LQSLDGARAAARRIGQHLHLAGLLDAPDDVFDLTASEIAAGRWGAVRDQARERGALRAEYETLELPVTWRGMPPRVIAKPVGAVVGEEPTSLAGIGASPGVIEGRVVVVSDPGDIDLEDGDILVAHTTDPGWAAVMFLSSALVVDIGGLLSH